MAHFEPKATMVFFEAQHLSPNLKRSISQILGKREVKLQITTVKLFLKYYYCFLTVWHGDKELYILHSGVRGESHWQHDFSSSL